MNRWLSIFLTWKKSGTEENFSFVNWRKSSKHSSYFRCALKCIHFVLSKTYKYFLKGKRKLKTTKVASRYLLSNVIKCYLNEFFEHAHRFENRMWIVSFFLFVICFCINVHAREKLTIWEKPSRTPCKIITLASIFYKKKKNLCDALKRTRDSANGFIPCGCVRLFLFVKSSLLKNRIILKNYF